MFNRKTLFFAIVVVSALGLLAGVSGSAPASADDTKTWIIHLNLRDTDNTTAIGVKDLDAYADIRYSYWNGSKWSPWLDADLYAVSSCSDMGYTFKKTPSAAVETPSTATYIYWDVSTYRPSSQASDCGGVKYMQDGYHEWSDYTSSTVTNLLWDHFEQESW